MGAVLSSAAVADAAKAYKNIAQPRLIAPDTTADDHDDEYDYWSALPDDLLVTIMAGLDIQSLRRSGAVCTSWRHAHGPFRLPALEQVPCLLYACEEYGPNDLALYCPTTDATFRVPFPGPPHDKRGFTFSCPAAGCSPPTRWATPTYSTPSPVSRPSSHRSRRSTTMTPTTTTMASTSGKPTSRTVAYPASPGLATLSISRSPSPRPPRDGLLYILYINGSISTLDLTGPSPLVTTIMDRVIRSGGFHNMYLVHGPSDIVKEICENCAELAGEPDNEDKLSEKITNDNEDEHYEDEHYEAVAANQEIDVSQLLREGIDLPHRLVDEVTTIELLVFKVDIKRKKLVELRDHAFFLGHNSAVCLPTQDFPAFEPNCAYLTDDCFDYSPMLRKDLGVWNIKKTSMQKLGEAWPNLHPWLHLPPPI
ncbi:hypothetical protein ACQ4PT_002645 [Festuca glaucescens]